jgi:glycosyltransferase involved in cell wall biosynthesis
MPKITVIIPTCNRAEFLRSAIASVLNQTFQDFEIVIIDDASRDHTQDVVTNFKDTRIKLIRHQVSKGAAGARNTGIMNSNCEYIAFLDDDDEWLPDKLHMQIDLLENSSPEVGGVCTSRLTINGTSRRVSYIWDPELPLDLSKDNFITTSSILLRRKCFEEFGLFDESMPSASDYDMWIRISKKFSFEFIREPLTKYYIHEDSITYNYGKKIRGIEILFEKHDEFFKSNPRSYAQQYLNLGVFYCYNGEVQKGRKAFKQSIRMNPFEISNYFNFCLSLLGAKRFKKIKKVKEKVFIRSSAKVTL